MTKDYINIDFFGENINSIFIHKPYNFKRETVSDEERIKQIKKVWNEEKVILPIQSHTNIVKVLDEKNINDSFEDTDGLITNLKDVAIGTLSADCQCILMYDEVNKVIGNVHSGWKGTLTRISTNAVKLMEERFNTNPKDIKIFITPSIHKCCFEVDEELKNEFENEFKDIDQKDIFIKGEVKDNKQKYFIDTIEINKRVLMNLGVEEENIKISELCSSCNSDIIHSYRKDKPNDGRNIALIKIKNN